MNTVENELRQTWVAVEGSDGRTRMEARWVLASIATVATAAVPHAA